MEPKNNLAGIPGISTEKHIHSFNKINPYKEEMLSDCPVDQITSTYRQPNGHEFTATQKGTAFFHYLITEDGYLLQQDKKGYWCYTREKQLSETKSELVLSPNRYLIDNEPEMVITEEKLSSITNLQFPSTKESKSTNTSLASPANSTSKNIPSYITPTISRNIPLLVILINFSDIKLYYSDSSWSNLFFGTGKSVKDYFQKTSNSKINFQPVAETSGTSNDGIVRVTLNSQHPNSQYPSQQSVEDAVEKAASYVNFENYADDELSIVLIYAGYERSYKLDSSPSIWASNGYNVWMGDLHFGAISVMGERHGNSSNYHQATIGPACHELGHYLDLPDLYNQDKCSNVGIFSLMGYSWTYLPNEHDGTTPPQLDAFSKIRLGIYTPTSVSVGQTGNKDVYTYKKTGNTQVIKIATNRYFEYYLIENRTYRNDGEYAGNYDQVLQTENTRGTGGLVIYYVMDDSWSASVNLLRATEFDPVYYFGINKDGDWQERTMNNADRTPATDAFGKIYPWFTAECYSAPGDKMTVKILSNTVSLGDVNGDGVVSSTDAGMILSISVGQITRPVKYMDAADVDGIGGVNTTDSRLVLQYANGMITSFPRPIG